MRPLLALILFIAAGCTGSGPMPPPDSRAPLSESPGPTPWEFSDAKSWEVVDGVLRLHTPGTPGGPIRRPSAWALLRGEPFGDVTVTARVRSDAPVDRMGRDVLLYFGFQSPTRFYYVHLSNETTAPHNGIFLVDDADRVRIDDGSAEPRLMDADWHKVRLVRRASTGEILVYFDDLETPLMQAVDRTLTWGRVGFGSFDDTGAFREIRVEGWPE